MSIHITIDADLMWEPSLAELWPDGDAPDEVDAETIVALIEKCGGVERVLRDWNLLHDLELSIVVRRDNPHFMGDAVLFGDPPPRELITSERMRA